MAIIFRNAGCGHGHRHTDLDSMSIALLRFFVNRNRDSSYNWHFLHVRFGDRIVSIDFHFVEIWFLDVMNIILLIVFLNNWLGNSFLPGNGNGLEFLHIVNFALSSDGFQLNLFVFTLSNLQIYSFSIDNWL